MGTHPIFESDFDCLTENCCDVKMVKKIEKDPPKLKVASRKKKQGLTGNQKALYGLGAVTVLFVGVVFVIPMAQQTYKEWTDPVITLTNSNFSKYIKNTPEIMVEFYAPWCGHCKALAPEYEAAAITLQANGPSRRLAKVDCIANQQVCQQFNVTGYPTLKYFENGEEDRPFNGARNADAIVSFMMKEAKSEPIPETQGDLKKIVNKNMEELVLNTDSDVFIKFYAPWCGHCKAMAEDWEKLATEYADDSSLTIAEFDATANDVVGKGFDYTGFPTLFWVGADKVPIKYEGGRTIEDWEKYISEHKSGVSRDEL